MAIETLRPNAAGDECNISSQTGAACPNHYQNVDETPPDEATTTVQSNAIAYERDFYNIEDSGVSSGTINHIKVYARCICDSGDTGPVASLKIVIKSGTGAGAPDTPSESSPITVSNSTWNNHSNQWNTNPATAAAWTWDEIDKLQAGVSLKVATYSGRVRLYTYCTQVYVEVDYTPVVGTNMKVNIADVFKDISEIKINIAGVWKDVAGIKINIGDVWKDVF